MLSMHPSPSACTVINNKLCNARQILLALWERVREQKDAAQHAPCAGLKYTHNKQEKYLYKTIPYRRYVLLLPNQNQRLENKNGMRSKDVNTGAKWTAHFINWQSKRNNKAECNQSHLHHELPSYMSTPGSESSYTNQFTLVGMM